MSKEYEKYEVKKNRCWIGAKWTKEAISTGKMYRRLLVIHTFDVKFLRH